MVEITFPVNPITGVFNDAVERKRFPSWRVGRTRVGRDRAGDGVSVVVSESSGTSVENGVKRLKRVKKTDAFMSFGHVDTNESGKWKEN